MTQGFEPPALPDTHYLDNRIFTDETIFAQEQKDIFAKVWQFVCHESKLPAAGDFRTTAVAGEPIVIVRGTDHAIRSFHNVCHHRASPVVRQDAGNATEFQCFYHLWTYGLDGRCTAISKPAGYDAVKLYRDALGLIPVRTDTIAGLVFVCLSPDTEPLAEYLRDIMGPVLEPLGRLPLKVFPDLMIKVRASGLAITTCSGARPTAISARTSSRSRPSGPR